MKRYVELILDFLELAFVGATVFILVYLFVGQLLEVTGNSMLPTFINGEQIIAEKVSTKFKPLHRGEIVIFRHPEANDRLLIKRVIGLPEEKIEVSEGLVYINGEELNESYLNEQGKTYGHNYLNNEIEYDIPVGQYVLMGDNRTESSDSRVFGFIPDDLIVGRALLVYYPITEIKLIKY